MKQEATGTNLVVTRAPTSNFESLANTQHRRRPDLQTLYLNSHLVTSGSIPCLVGLRS